MRQKSLTSFFLSFFFFFSSGINLLNFTQLCSISFFLFFFFFNFPDWLKKEASEWFPRSTTYLKALSLLL